jgi:plastocyanin
VAAAVVTAACGGGAAAERYPDQTYGAIVVTLVRPGTTPYVSPTPAVGDAVAVLGLAYDPTTLEVPLGSTVTWTNRDAIAHTVTSGVPGFPDGFWDGQLFTGATFARLFTQPGTYAYYCRFHTSMAARLVVR